MSDDSSSEDELQWSLRVSRQARCARLRIRPFGGLEVVIPTRFPRNRVAELVAQHDGWARRQLARQARLRAAIELPSALSLAIDDSITPIRYRGAKAPQQDDLFTVDSVTSTDFAPGYYHWQLEITQTSSGNRIVVDIGDFKSSQACEKVRCRLNK